MLTVSVEMPTKIRIVRTEVVKFSNKLNTEKIDFFPDDVNNFSLKIFWKGVFQYFLPFFPITRAEEWTS